MRIWIASGLPVLAVMAACASNDMPDVAEGATLFANNCTACHGYRGTGSERLINGEPAPDLTRISARNGGVFPSARVLSQIDGYGRGKVDSAVMPEFGALLEGDLVPVDIEDTLTPTPRPLAALLVYLKSIQVR